MQAVAIPQITERLEKLPTSHRHARGGRAGEVFSVVRPEMSKEMERKVWEEVREVLAERGLLCQPTNR